MRCLRVLGLLVVASLLLGGCNDKEESEPAKPPEAPKVAALPLAWTAEWPEDWLDAILPTGDRAVAVLRTNLLGLDLADGSKKWTLPVNTCAISRAREDDGLFAVVFTQRQRNSCQALGVVDPATGTWLWKTRLKRAVDATAPGQTSPVAIGDSTVTVVTTCCYAEALRFDLESGKAVEDDRPGPDRVGCLSDHRWSAHRDSLGAGLARPRASGPL